MRLVDGNIEQGHHQVIWTGTTAEGQEVPSAIYITRMITPAYTKPIERVLPK